MDVLSFVEYIISFFSSFFKKNSNDKELISKIYFELIYYSELHSSNYKETIEIFNKVLSENTVLSRPEKELLRDRVSRNIEREKELFKRGEPFECSHCKLTRYSTHVEYLADGGFAKIYTAKWKRGAILDWNESKQEFIYQGSHKVVLKSLNNSKQPTKEFFDEAKALVNVRSGDIVNAYGITKFPQDGNYAIVMNYFGEGNLRIDDDNVRKLYGIVPYMAPELFLLQKYTKASDIYSVGMLMWEIFGGFPPFNDIPHDLSTISNIISGLRPPMLSEIPNEIQSLIKRCWNGDPSKRPTIEEILDVIKYQYRQILENEELSIAYDNEKKTYSGSRKANKPTNQTYHTSRILSLSEKDINKFVIPEDFDDENVDWE
ncbi:unnamed protein product [Rhizophagus irregularis]|nr:unnamed protein product [Rhizophagus irregularis]